MSKVSREELYDLVWTKPITKIAEEFGLSAQMIGTACKKYNIPRPKSGYWQKLEHGKIVDKPDLPALESVYFLDVDNVLPYPDYIVSRINRRKKEIEASSLPLVVPKRIGNLESLVKVSRNILSGKKPGYMNHTVATYREGFSINVSPGIVSRALRLANSIVKLIEARGHSIYNDQGKTLIEIDNEKFEVRIREKLRREVVKRGTWDHTELFPTGLLMFKIDDFNAKEWVDGNELVEDKLSIILATLEIRAEIKKKERLEREEWRREQEKIREQERLEKQKRDWETKKIEILKSDANRFDEYLRMKKFITKIESENNLEGDQKSKWLKWAYSVVQSYNPITNNYFEKYEFDPDFEPEKKW